MSRFDLIFEYIILGGGYMIKVCIDPGHGGQDRNNRGPSGYIEADGVLKISRFLKEELEASGQFTVILTRDGDATLSLTQRGRLAASNKVDLFISQHTNAGPATAGGTEVFYSVDLPGDREFAERLSMAVASVLGIKNRGAKVRESTTYRGEDYYTVIDTAQDGGVPHVLLIESAFHSNPEEEKLLLNDEVLRKIAKAQAEVIYDFFDITKGENPSPVSSNINANAVVQGDWLYARRADGSIEPGRRVDIGDKIEVLDIGYSTQLVFVEYPILSGSRRAYVRNGSWIKYLNPYNGQVTISKLDTRQTPGGQVIGSVFGNEKVTILQQQGNWLNIAYDTRKGRHTKSGWVEAEYIKRL
jgi:N-acetylmuramoyl-L-alanine amidase